MSEDRKLAGQSPGEPHEPRTFGPTNLALRNRTSIAALLAILTILGIVSYVSVPKESSPEILIPMISIATYSLR